MNDGRAGDDVDAARWYLDEVLAQIPRILTLIDRDPTSPTYGCFDRNYWHYRTQDFPSGMYQELALPLAQVWALDVPGNPWRGEARIRELALAAIRYAARSAHPDASCDDYYPFERALGATAFVANASAEAMRVLDATDADILAFARKRCTWLVNRHETGRLSNHQALVALAAARTARLCNDESLLAAARSRLDACLDWQHAEGWFPEYEGADPGYQTLTIAFLSALRPYLPSPRLDDALRRAADFAAHFLHPDGSFAGETGSRNTCQVLPSGFERLAANVPAAAWLADGWLRGARARLRGFPDDDRIVCHWLGDYLQAWEARRSRSMAVAPWSPPSGTTAFPAAHLVVVREAPLHLVVATSKGGVFRAYSGPRLLANDTGLVGVTTDGRRVVSHLVDPTPTVSADRRSITVRGRMHVASRKLAAPMKQVVFRIINATIGRVAPNLLRLLLQKVLITGRKSAPYSFERTLTWNDAGELTVRDRVEADSGAPPLERVLASTDATSIYVATSNLWQNASLLPWSALPSLASGLRETGAGESLRSFR